MLAKCCACRRWHHPAEGGLWSIFVVFASPALGHGSGVQQGGEPVLVEARVAQAAVEGLDVGVLARRRPGQIIQAETALRSAEFRG